MFNSINYTAIECTRERRTRLLEEARQFRLGNQVWGNTPTIYTRTALILGDLFISLGEWLKQRAAPNPTSHWQSRTV